MTRFADHQVEQVKRLSVRKLAEDAGVVLKGLGAELRGLCPFHEDRAPSLVVNTEKNLWKCLGACNRGGSPIDWVMAAEGVTFVEAVKLLLPKISGDRESLRAALRATTVRRESPVSPEADERTALNQVRDHYWQTLKGSQTAQAYLAERMLGSAELVDEFRLGFSDRSLGLSLPAKNRAAGAEVRTKLVKLGILKESGHELFSGRLMVPVTDEAGDVVWMYGRMVGRKQRDGVPRHLNLPGPKRGVFNLAGVASSKTVVLCEAVIDALTLWRFGYRNVTCTFGVSGLTEEHLAAFRKYGTEQVLIAFDRDPTGNSAAFEVAQKLQAEGMDCHRVELPAGFDVNLYAQRFPGEAEVGLGLLLRNTTWIGKGKPRALRPVVLVPAVVPAKDAAVEAAPAREPAPALGSISEALLSLAADPSVEPAAELEATPALEPGLPMGAGLPRPPAAAVVAAPARLPAASSPPLASVTAPSALPPAAAPSSTPSSPPSASVPAPVTPPAAAPSSSAASAPPLASVPAPTAPLASLALPPAAATPARVVATPVPEAPHAPELAAEVKEDELLVTLGDRLYRVRGLAKNLSHEQLKVTVRCTRGALGDPASVIGLHLDTLDLYSARQRAVFVKQAAKELRVKEEAIGEDLRRLLLKLEELQDEQIKKALTPKPASPAMSEQEREEALALLRSPDLLAKIREHFGRCGVVGEETNTLVGYLAAVSRKLPDPLAVIVQSSSAAGKSSLMDGVLAFMPEEERVRFSAMTGQSLFYMGETNLKHKVLAISEEEGAARAVYALKLLQSEKELTIASTGKDPATGKLVTHEYRVEGPVMIFLTTTAIDVEEELLNRCVVLSVNEEQGQTMEIHRRQRRRETLEGLLGEDERARLVRLHQNAQRLLETVRVVNPFAEELTFLHDRTRTRRDQMKYLTLIRSVALLHQHQRPRKSVVHQGKELVYLEVTREDIAAANELSHQVLGRSLDELSPQTRRFLHLLEELVKEGSERAGVSRLEYQFRQRDIRARTGLTDIQVRTHLGKLVALEYVTAHRIAGPGLSAGYQLAYDGQGKDGRPFLMGLLDVTQLHGYVAGSEGSGGGTEHSGSGSEAHASANRAPSEGEPSGVVSGEDASKAAGFAASEPKMAENAVKRPARAARRYVLSDVAADDAGGAAVADGAR